MKRLAIVTALLAATAWANLPGQAAPQEGAEKIQLTQEDNIAEINRVKAETLRQNAADLQTSLNDLTDFAAQLETKMDALEDGDLNTRELIRMDLNITRSEIGAIEAEQAALIARAEELEAEAGLPPTLLVSDETDAAAEDEGATDPVAPPTSVEDFLNYSNSELVQILLSEELRTDDVAIMGIISGARKVCDLNWEPGFVDFILIANQNGYDLSQIAAEHGLYMGAATKNVRASGYQCVDEDRAALRAINPF